MGCADVAGHVWFMAHNRKRASHDSLQVDHALLEELGISIEDVERILVEALADLSVKPKYKYKWEHLSDGVIRLFQPAGEISRCSIWRVKADNGIVFWLGGGRYGDISYAKRCAIETIGVAPCEIAPEGSDGL